MHECLPWAPVFLPLPVRQVSLGKDRRYIAQRAQDSEGYIATEMSENSPEATEARCPAVLPTREPAASDPCAAGGEPAPRGVPVQNPHPVPLQSVSVPFPQDAVPLLNSHRLLGEGMRTVDGVYCRTSQGPSSKGPGFPCSPRTLGLRTGLDLGTGGGVVTFYCNP